MTRVTSSGARGILLLAALSPMLCAAAGRCGEWQMPQAVNDPYIRASAPVIFGKAYSVPEMRIRVLDGSTGQPLRPKSLTLNYGWRWLEYPYSEHAWGVWSNSSDSASCQPDESGWLDVPPHEVHPRGWYDGKYTRFPLPRKPSFTEVEVVINTGYFARVHLKPGDLRRFVSQDLTIRVHEGWRTELSWDQSRRREPAD